MKSTITEQPSGLFQAFPIMQSPNFWGLGAIAIVLFVAMKWSEGAKNAVLSHGKLAGKLEKCNAQEKALNRIQARKHNEVGLWIKSPRKMLFSSSGLHLCEDSRTLYFPNCESGILAMGDNGSGKSFSSLQPLLMSGLLQGFPAVYFDIKYSSHKPDEPAPCAQVGGLALRQGYDVKIFAPSLGESCRINPLDLIRSPIDTEMAMQFSKVLYRNVIGDAEKGGQFFPKGAIACIAGLSLISKLTPYPDLLTVRELANLEVDEFKKLLQSLEIPESTKMVFDILKQASGDAYGDLKATVSSVLSQILMPAVIPSLMGKSDIDFDIDGKQLLIFGVDGERRDVVCPIIATVIHLLTNKNLLRARKNPYLLWLDELPAIYLPEVDQWPNQFRSAGLVLAVGTQSPEMLEARYGKDGTKRILKGLNTQFIFQLGSISDCKTYAETVGDRDIVFESRGKSFGRRSKSSSRNENRQVRPIIEASEIAQFPQGKAAIWSRGFSNSQRSRVPLVEKIDIPKADLKLIEECQGIWEHHITELKANHPLQPIGNEAFQVRRDYIQRFLKSPEQVRKDAQNARSILNIEDRLDSQTTINQRSLSHA